MALTWRHPTSRHRVSLFLTSLLLLASLYKLRTPSPTPSSIFTDQPRSIPDIDLSLPTAPFIAWPLARVCAETTPIPGLLFICDNNSGGPGNIRNYILLCIRYAIDAGATSLLVPQIRTRSPDDLANLFTTYRPLSYMFDESHFLVSLTTACPHITIYKQLLDVPGVRETVQHERLPNVEHVIEQITPKHFGRRGGCDNRDINRHTDRWSSSFRHWLNETAVERGHKQVGKIIPRVVRLSWGVLWDWPTFKDGPEFAATFGGLLKIRGDIVALGENAITRMRNEDDTAVGSSSDKILGVHLRTENDALSLWPTYDMQSSEYIKEAEKRGFKGGVAYLASGNQTEARKFADLASSKIDLRVYTKFDILEGTDLKRLENMSWDQQALVDFVVLLETDYFVGVSPSSFSINVALKRHLRIEGLHSRPWKIGGLGDGRSWLVGHYEQYWDDWLFMFDGTWA